MKINRKKTDYIGEELELGGRHEHERRRNKKIDAVTTNKTFKMKKKR